MDKLKLLDSMNGGELIIDVASSGSCKSCGYKADNPEYKFCPNCGKELKGALSFEAFVPDQDDSETDEVFGVRINGKEYLYQVDMISDPSYEGKLKGKYLTSKDIVSHVNSLAEKAGPGKALQFVKKYWKPVSKAKTDALISNHPYKEYEVNGIDISVDDKGYIDINLPKWRAEFFYEPQLGFEVVELFLPEVFNSGKGLDLGEFIPEERFIQFLEELKEDIGSHVFVDGLVDSEKSLDLTAKIEELMKQISDLEEKKETALDAGNSVEEIEEEIWEKKLEVEELKQELANLKE